MVIVVIVVGRRCTRSGGSSRSRRRSRRRCSRRRSRRRSRTEQEARGELHHFLVEFWENVI